MKQIGPNMFVGDDPYICMMAADISIENNRRAAESERKFKLLSPADKFLFLLSERTTKPRRFGCLIDHNYFRFSSDALISVFKTEKLTGVDDCNKFMCHLESIYVVDSARGTGLGRSCIAMLTEIAEESGCALELFCNPFVWSCDGRNANALESFDDLWGVVFDEGWDVLYHTDYQKELTKFFYSQSGFRNMCIYDEWVYRRDKSEDLPLEQQFVYLPSTIKAEYLQQLQSRLNKGECEYCNRI